MALTFHNRRSQAALMGLALVGTLLVTPAHPPIVTASTVAPSVWNQVGADIVGADADNPVGGPVAMSSDGYTVIIGARASPFRDDESGPVRVFHFDGTAWSQVGGDINGEAPGDRAGYSVAISSDGNTISVGAHLNRGTAFNSGHVRVYRFVGTDWVQVGGDIDGEAAGDFSGSSLAMSSDGDTVIIGAPGNDDNGFASGHVRVYRFDGTDWVQVGGDIDGEAVADFSRGSVAMSSDGNVVTIGATSNDGTTLDSGHVRVYRLDGAAWVQIGGDIDGEAASDFFGSSVAMSSDGNTVIIGARNNDGSGRDSGHSRVYRFDGLDWVQVGGDIDGEAGGDRSGRSVAMSDDGNTIVIGAPENDVPGRDSGHARVYRFDGTDWVQVGGDIDGEAAGDRFGNYVAMSGDGNTVIIGAHFADGNGGISGYSRVYQFGSLALLACGDIAGTADELAVAGYNVIIGTNGADFLPGTPGNDFILGLDGRDVILAGMGDDVVCAGGGHDVVVGGDGADSLHGEGGNDAVWGGNHDDHITGGTGGDILDGGDGDDDVSGDGADDTIRGGHDDDVLRGGPGKDDIGGDAGNDMLFGNRADDVLRGHTGIDVCDGGTHVHGDQAFSCETLINIP